MLLSRHFEELGLVQAEVFDVLGVKIGWVLDIIFLRALRHCSFLDLCAFFLVRLDLELAGGPTAVAGTSLGAS